jgi:predicted AAA+ superfamily ATPase
MRSALDRTDDDPRPGRFVLTRSAVADLRAETWPGTGRIVRLAMYGLTVREVVGASTGPTFLGKLALDEPEAFVSATDVPDLGGYVDLALTGGYPEPVLRLSADARSAWIDSYLSSWSRATPNCSPGRATQRDCAAICGHWP